MKAKVEDVLVVFACSLNKRNVAFSAIGHSCLISRSYQIGLGIVILNVYALYNGL